MGIRQDAQGFSTFAKFLAYLMVFQSGACPRRYYETLKTHQIYGQKNWQKLKKSLVVRLALNPFLGQLRFYSKIRYRVPDPSLANTGSSIYQLFCPFPIYL